MATAAADSSASGESLNYIHSETIPVIDLHHLSQPELFSLSLCSSSSSLHLHQNDPDVSTLKIDRSVFNESAGSRKQTFSRLRLAPRKNSQLSHSSPINGSVHQAAELTSDEDSSRIVALLKSMFGGNPDDANKIEGNLVSVPIQFNGYLDWNDVDGGVSDCNGNAEMKQIADDDSTTKKRKRGRPRRDESNWVGDNNLNQVIERAASNLKVEKNATTEKMEEFGNMEDPYVKELTRRTIDMQTHEQLLEFLQGLDGEWLSKRKKRKIVGACELGDLLPSGWKLMLCVMKRAGYFWIGCRRFISPNGQQFMSCKEASTYLNSSLSLEDASQLNFGVDGNIQMTERKTSENASEVTLVVEKNEGALVSCPELPIISKSVEHDKEPMKVGIPGQDETVREYKCHKCTMVFGEPDDLLEHLLSSHQRAPKRLRQETTNEEVIMNNGKYECQFCHKSYDERHRYNGHLGNHIKDYFKRTQASREALGIKRSSIPPSVAVHPSAMNIQEPPSVAVHPSAVNIQESTEMDIGSVAINSHSQCSDEIKDAVPDCKIKENDTKEPYCGNQGLVCSLINDKSGDSNDTVAVEANTVPEGSPKFSFDAVGRKQMCAPDNNENQLDMNLIEGHAHLLSSDNNLAVVSSIENSENTKDRLLSSAGHSVENHNRDFVGEDKARTILANNCSSQHEIAANGEEQRNLTCERGSQVGLSPSLDEKIGMSNDKVTQVSNTTMKESGYDDIGGSSKDVLTVGFGSNNATVEDCVTGIELDRSSRSHLVIPTWVNQASYTENEMKKHEQERKYEGEQLNLFGSEQYLGSANTVDKLSHDTTKMPNHDKVLHFQNIMHKKGADLIEAQLTAAELESCSGNSLLVPSGNELPFAMKEDEVLNGAPKYLVQDINSDRSSRKPSSDEQILNHENNLNMVSLVPVDQPKHKEVKSFSKGDMHIAFDYSHMEWDADVRSTTPESYSNDYSLVTSGSQWNAAEANLTGLYCSPLEEQDRASTKGLLHLSNSVEEWSAGQNSDRFLRGEDRKKLAVVKPKKNQAVTGIGSNNQASENVISGLMWKHDEENDLLGSFAGTSRRLAHSSSCFTTYDLLSDKGGNELFGEKYSDISGFQGLRSGNMENMEYNFMSNHSEETKIFSGDAEIAQGFGSSGWLEKGALPLLPKMAGRQRIPASCAWCKNEFYYEGFESEAQIGSMNFTCEACKAKFSGNFNFL